MNDRIRKLRKNLDLTQQEFADSLGIKRSTVATYETGKSNPSDSAVVLICTKFNVNEEWLRNGTGEMFKANPTDELDALAKKYNLTHQDCAFIEYLLKNTNARRAMENFCINYAISILNDYISEDTPAFPPYVPDAALAESAYEKSLGIVPNREFTASNIIDDTEENTSSSIG